MNSLALLLTVAVKLSAASIVADLPLPPGAHHANRFTTRPDLVPSVVFTIDADFPAAPAIDFYDEYFTRLGWRRCAYPTKDKWGVMWEVKGGTQVPDHVRGRLWIGSNGEVLAYASVTVHGKSGDTETSPPPRAQDVHVVVLDEPESVRYTLETSHVTCEE